MSGQCGMERAKRLVAVLFSFAIVGTSCPATATDPEEAASVSLDGLSGGSVCEDECVLMVADSPFGQFTNETLNVSSASVELPPLSIARVLLK